MVRVTAGFGVALLCTLSGCGPHVAYNVTAGYPVERDRIVESWTVNGERVELKSLNPAPGCYVIGVKYSEVYVRSQMGARGVSIAYYLAGAFAAMGAFMADLKQTKYESEQVPYALEVRKDHKYWVTATFTGDEFFGRIVETDKADERTGQTDPAKSIEELRACKARTPMY